MNETTVMDFAQITAKILKDAKEMNYIFKSFFESVKLENVELNQKRADRSAELRREYDELCHHLRVKGIYVAEIAFFDGIFCKVQKLLIGNEEIILDDNFDFEIIKKED